ncbi:hypothetical protein [Streptomyces decoyicus]|uniref:hypothetical protein n=1 Tax=Streptomyces decoyicus TaxID=249567 RepID=UPI0004ABAAE1
MGSLLSAETERAAHCGVSRGTVCQAVAVLTAEEGLIGAYQGARHVVLAGCHGRNFTELYRFA